MDAFEWIDDDEAEELDIELRVVVSNVKAEQAQQKREGRV